MLALRMLWRCWRGGQLGLIFLSLVLAVAVVSSVALLAERVEKALINESSSLLAADLMVRSADPFDQSWMAEAQNDRLQTSRMLLFSSMVYHGDELHLASVKAVEPNYPLRGTLKLTQVPFTTDETEVFAAQGGPPSGEAWVDARLLPLLNIELGDEIELGEVKLKVTEILAEEPDRGSAFSLLGARVLMNWADIEASGVVQPGSRVDYRLLLAGDQRQLANYQDWLRPQLEISQRITTPERAEERVSRTLERARSFLMLAGSIGVVLAGIALAMASRHFANGQTLQVALLKSWGLSAGRIRRLYGQQSLWLGLIGSLFGLLLGYGVHEILIQLVREWLPVSLPAAGWRSWTVGLATGLLCLMGFALPALWHLPAQSPMAVLRQDIVAQPLGLLVRLMIGVVTILLLMLWYSASVQLTFSLLAGFALVVLASMAVGFGLLRLGKSYGHHFGSLWRLALSNLWRRRVQSLIQMVGFSGAITLLMVMALVRTSLVDEWRWQLDENTPNHFLVNVAPYELEGVKEIIAQRNLDSGHWYSMVRGRLTSINGEAFDNGPGPGGPERERRGGPLRRELNLSWSNDLPEGNEIVSGSWWPNVTVTDGRVPVSVEQGVAEEMGFQIGDHLSFNIGGLPFDAEISSIRSLNWDRMTPNFFFLFPEGYLDDFPRIYMTSMYIPPEEKLLVNDLLRAYPTILVIELDKIIDRIQTIVSQVTRGLEMMTLMILGCGIMVMFAAVSLSMSERLTESAVLRTLGSSSKQILGIQLVEFAMLGVMSGLLAVFGTELAVALLQHFAFDLAPSLHPWIWLIGPLSGAVLVGVLGVWYSRKAVVQPPLQVLRAV